MTSNDDVFKGPASGHGVLIHCRTCGRPGFDRRRPTREEDPTWWGWAHIDGHPFACEICGRHFISAQALRSHAWRHRTDEQENQ